MTSASPSRSTQTPTHAGEDIESIVEHIEDHLLQRRVGDDRQIGAERVGDSPAMRRRPRSAPFLHQLVEEGIDRRHARRLAARLAGRQQDAGDDRLAALHRRLHFFDFLQQLGIGRDQAGMRRQSPRMTDKRCQRRAELVRRAGREQPHAHDVIFFRRVLLQGRETSVALAQVARDAGHEDDQQSRVEREADEHADDVQLEQIAAVRAAMQAAGRIR